MKNLNTILSVVIIALLVILVWALLKKPENKVVSSVYHSVHIDTVPFIVKEPIYIQGITPKPPIPDPIDTSLLLTEASFSDSLLDASIKTRTNKTGYVVSHDFSYKPKFPKYINRVDSIRVTTTETVEKYKEHWAIFAGANVYSNLQTVNLAPMIHFKTKSEYLFSAGYNPFNKDIHAGVSIRLLGSKRK